VITGASSGTGEPLETGTGIGLTTTGTYLTYSHVKNPIKHKQVAARKPRKKSFI